MNERQECYKNLCSNPKSGEQIANSAVMVDGRWIWQEAVKPNSNK